MKGKFNAKIAAEFTPPKTWVLQKPLSFSSRLIAKDEVSLLRQIGVNVSSHKSLVMGKVTCVEGMQTDLASVPRIVWAVISPWDVARAAVIHDHLYASLRKYFHSSNPELPFLSRGQRVSRRKSTWRRARKLSDNIFLWGMQSAEPPVPAYKMWSAYWSVRLFGRWPASAKEKN